MKKRFLPIILAIAVLLQVIPLFYKTAKAADNVSVSYSTHVQNVGWQNYAKDCVLGGTTGRGLRLEGIKINLTGSNADNYDVYYKVHAETYGWLDWAKNGDIVGTVGLSKRLEAIEIKIVKKGAAAPGSTIRPCVSN